MADNGQKFILPLLITRNLVLFPSSQKMIDAGRPISMTAIDEAIKSTDSLIFVVTQKSADIADPKVEDLFEYGTFCRIVSNTRKDNVIKIRVEVVERAHFTHIELDERGFYVATGEILSLDKPNEEVSMGYVRSVIEVVEKIPSVVSTFPRSVANIISRSNDIAEICYAIASSLDLPLATKQQILQTESVEKLVTTIISLLKGEEQKDEIERKLQETIRVSSEKSQKEYFLREKLKAIKKELGDDTNGNDEASVMERLEKYPYPESIKAKIKSEFKKMGMMPQGSLESALIQSYIDTLLDIPWYQKTEDNEDLDNVEKILNEDHFGLENPKKRIVEYLAVKKLTGNLNAPILCFYGPPGCGKTSLGKSIARALGRSFFKASLGGISDEAEIRGHRRTYVGSMPGRIIQGMRKAKVRNPVFLLDEVDKLASSYKGDPASALLEVLDPEQNTAFNDNFVEEPYDLSDVLFICTANYLQNIPAPLRDRLELIEVNSYTEIEKVQIAKRHLVDKQIKLNGLNKKQVSFTDGAIKHIIRSYTREAGVRELERKIASCIRKVAVSIVKDSTIKSIKIDEAKVEEYLGIPLFEDSKKEKEKQIGVVTGLAYTEYGGDILPIEVTYFKGKGDLVLTGNLGDVMKESATIALDYVKANAKKYNIDPEIFKENSIHIHVPEGAVPKDGPSAGVALTTAIISCLSKKPVNPDVAMTGEVTLRGYAKAIGGLREKSLAALRSGIKTIIVPSENKKDVSELPKEVKDSLKIVYMNNVDDAYKVAFKIDD